MRIPPLVVSLQKHAHVRVVGLAGRRRHFAPDELHQLRILDHQVFDVAWEERIAIQRDHRHVREVFGRRERRERDL